MNDVYSSTTLHPFPASPSLHTGTLVRAILFEPRQWVPPQGRTKIEEIPTNAANLATPFGLLMNEVLFSPRATVEPLLQMLYNGVTLAVGNYASSFVEVFLFLIRIAVQVEAYVNETWHAMNPPCVHCQTVSFMNVHATMVDKCR